MSRQKTLTGFAAFLFLGWAIQTHGLPTVVGIETVHAAGITSNDVLSTMSYITSFLVTVLDVLMWVLFQLLDIVTDPDVIFGGANSELTLRLQSIWQLSRDLMNVIFALLLIVGAVLTIITAKGELVKTYAPKFVMAVVFVNFSWFVPRVIFDVSQITAYTVYQIPSLISTASKCETTETDPVTGVRGKPQPCQIVTQVKFLKEAEQIGKKPKDAGDPSGKRYVDGWYCPIENFVCYQQKPITDTTLDVSPDMRIINGIIINHARLRTLTSFNGAQQGNINGNNFDVGALIAFLLKMAMVLIVEIALFFPLLALTMAFLIRIPILWITMAFMPFVFLEFVLPGKIPGDFSPMQKIWKGFLTAAFLPTLVGIPLAIGFILLNAGSNLPPPPALADKANSLLPIFTGISTLWDLVWMMIAIGILWTNVFAVLKSNEYIGGVTERIKSFGESAGRLAIKAPLAVPILPIGTGGAPQSILQTAHQFDPHRWENELSRTGTLPGRAGAGAAPDPAAINAAAAAAAAGQPLNATINANTTFITNVPAIAAAPDRTDPAIVASYTALMTELRTLHPAWAAERDDRVIIDGLRQAGVLTVPEAQALREANVANGGRP